MSTDQGVPHVDSRGNKSPKQSLAESVDNEIQDIPDPSRAVSPTSSMHSQEEGSEVAHDGFFLMSSSYNQQSAEAASPSRSTLWSVALFSISTILLFADQNLMAPNLTAIAHDFGFNDMERDQKLGGDIALAFFVLGAPASFIIGSMGDTYDRSMLFAMTVGIGEGSCLATAFSRTYLELYLARAITGFALGGALPLIYSVLGDLFAAEQRHMVGAIVGAGTGLGILLGQAVAGFIGPTFGWRLPFIIISIPALVCGMLVFFTVKDPPRGQMEAAAIALRRQQHDENVPFVDGTDGENSSQGMEMPPLEVSQTLNTSTNPNNGDASGLYRIASDDSTSNSPVSLEGSHDYWTTFRGLLATPTVILALLQGAPGCIPWGIVNTFLNDFLSEDKGMTIETATTVALVFGLGNFFGLMLGGAGGSYLYRKDRRFPAILAGVTSMAACFPFWFLINIEKSLSSSQVVWIGSSLLGFLSGATGPIVKATLQNVTLPQARGQAFALFNTFDDFGRGLGPVFVSSLIANLGGRQPAFNVGVLGWMLCGIVNLLIFFTVIKDEEHVQMQVSAQLVGREHSND